MTVREYREVRTRLIDAGHADEILWAETVHPPETAHDLWCEYGWVVVNSGMRATVARAIWNRIAYGVAHGRRATELFGHAAKARAIDEFRARRHSRLMELRALDGDPELTLAWAQGLPWIGPTTKYHLAKNVGVDCAKPDRWLERAAAASGEHVQDMCGRIARATGDRVATVDLVIWRACESGLWRPPAIRSAA